MAYFVKATQSESEYYYEVCDSARGKCIHENPTTDHRIYKFSRSYDANGLETSVMSESDAVREIKALEMLHSHTSAKTTKLSVNGKTV